MLKQLSSWWERFLFWQHTDYTKDVRRTNDLGHEATLVSNLHR